MTERQRAARIERRAKRAGLVLTPEALGGLTVYLELLTRWNRKINLTALPLEPLSEGAIDRLIVEPLVAAREVRPGDRVLVDLGSGGGSPGLPLKLTMASIGLKLVEVKMRKCAFLREAIRELQLDDAEVICSRHEELLTRLDLVDSIDIVSFRAIRADRGIWTTARGLLRPSGRVFWFTSAGEKTQIMLFNQINTIELPGDSAASRLIVAAPQP